MPERTARNPLDVFRSTLIIIRDKSFKNTDHEIEVNRDHVSAAVELIAAGLVPQAIRLRFMVSTGARMDNLQNSRFIPVIVDRLPKMNSTAGWIDESDGSSHSIERELMGRRYRAMMEGSKIAVTEYFRPEGQQDKLLFQIARRHDGFTGIEGVVTKIVPRQEAEMLLFTGSDENEKEQEFIVFKPIAARKELVAA